MKNIKKMTLLSAVLLVSCGANGTPSKGLIENTIENLRNGFKVESDIALVGTPHDKVYDPVYQNYQANYIFQNQEMVATETTIIVEEEDGSTYVAMHDLLKEGEDGSGYFLDLTYENKVIETQAIDDTGAVANFGLYYGNPFAYINESDFTKIDDNTYSLSNEKASFLSSRLFGILDDVFYALIEKTTFHFENNELKTIEMQPIDVDTHQQMGYEIIDLVISSSVEMTISEIGTAKVGAPVVKERKAEHSALETALKAVENNYTVFVKESFHETNLLSYTESDTYFESRYYFADDYLFWRPGYLEEYPEYDPGTDVVVKFNDDNSVTGYGLDQATNTWTTAALARNGLSGINENTVDVFRPIVSGVAPEVFDYDAEKDIYNISPELTPYIGIDCFVPLINAPFELNGYGTGCSIKLENGAIKEIIIDIYFNDNFSKEKKGTVTLEYSNIGTTTLPSDITIA